MEKRVVIMIWRVNIMASPDTWEWGVGDSTRRQAEVVAPFDASLGDVQHSKYEFPLKSARAQERGLGTCSIVIQTRPSQ